MNIEMQKKINKIKQDNYKKYIEEKTKNFEVLNKDNINKILVSIDEDYNNEKNIIIDKAIEFFYNQNKPKIFLNKKKYKDKIKKHLYIIEQIKNYLKRTNKINNNYTLYYCKHQSLELIDIYKKKKEIYKVLKYLIFRLSTLEQKYSNITKELYTRIKNYEELYNIRRYEQLHIKSSFEQQNKITNITNEVSKNIKRLKYNCDKIINNGFFGL